MPIEFRCVGCQKLLRTPDQAAGQQARCPECGAVMLVPGGLAPADASAGGPFAQTVGYPAGPEQERAAPPPGEGAARPYGHPATHRGPAMDRAATAEVQAYAATRLAGPATALIVTGAVGVAMSLMAVGLNVVRGGFVPRGMRAPMEDMLAELFAGWVGAGIGMLHVVLGVLVILGAMKMRRVESYGFAMASAILALIPCTSPCCLLGIPFGIWALVVLSDPHVRMAFPA